MEFLELKGTSRMRNKKPNRLEVEPMRNKQPNNMKEAKVEAREGLILSIWTLKKKENWIK